MQQSKAIPAKSWSTFLRGARKAWFFLPVLVLLSLTGQAATFTATGTGNWNAGATWGNLGNTAGVDYPDAGDIAVISGGFTITVTANQTVDSVSLASTFVFNTLTVNTGVTLTVTDGVGMSNGGGFGAMIMNINGTGVATIGNLNITNNTSGFAQIVMNTGASTLNISGTVTLNTVGTITPGTSSTINFNGTSAQTIPSTTDFKYHNLAINNTAGATLGAAITTSTVTGNVEVQSGTLNNGGFGIAGVAADSVQVHNGATLNLTGATPFPTGFTIDLQSGSTVDYSDNSGQTVDGRQYQNLTLSGTGAKELGGATDIVGELLVNAALATAGNTLTIVSNASGTGSIGNSSSTITGNVTIQRHVAALSTVTSFGHWFMLASGLADNQTDIEDWNGEFDISGFTGTEDPTSTFTSFYYYVEDSTGLKEVGYTAPGNTTDNLVNGRGYFAFIGGDSKGSMPKTLSISGSVQSGLTELTTNFNNNAASTEIGWNLLGNPYPAPVTWSSTARTNISGGSGGLGYVLDNGGDYDLMPTDRTVLASGEAFWVQASGASGSVRFTEGAKASPTTDPFHAKNSGSGLNPYLLRIWMTQGARTTKTNLVLEDGATMGYDVSHDGNKLDNVYGFTNIATVAEGRDLALNALPFDPGAGFEVPIRIYEPWPNGAVTQTELFFTGVDEFIQNGYCLVLEDRETQVFTPIMSDSAGYSVALSDTLSAPRFFLHLTAPLKNAIDPACYQLNNGWITVEPDGAGPFDMIWKNQSGAVIRSVQNVPDADSLQNLEAGWYSVEVNNTPGCSTTGRSFEVQELDEVTAVVQLPDTVYLVDGGLLELVNTTVGATQYHWDFGDGQTSDVRNPMYHYQQAGIFEVTYNASNGKCDEVITHTVTVLFEPVGIDPIGLEGQVRFLDREQGVVVSFELENTESIRLTVFNSLGQLTQPTRAFAGANVLVPVDLSRESPGVYFLKMEVGEETMTRKVVR